MQREDEVVTILKGWRDWYEEEESKISSVALVLLALEAEPTEKEWRECLVLSGLDIYDTQTRHKCVDSTVMFYYSGLLTLSSLEDDTWINPSHPLAFEGVTDTEYAEKVAEMKRQAKDIRDLFS